MTDAPVTLPIHCAHCGGAVTIQFAKSAGPAWDRVQAWDCPYCRQPNVGKFADWLAWVTTGHGPDEQA